MTNKTCGECKHLNRELAFCRACGAKWLNDNDGANCKYFEKLTPPTNGDKIREARKSWKPKDGEKFWFFNVYGGVVEEIYCTTYHDDRIEFGNCFRTKAEAQAAAEKVKDLLLSLHHGVGAELLAKAGLVELCKEFLSFMKKRPAKLPDWCKVGEWVYYRGYRKIIEVKALRLVLESAHCGNLTVYPEEIGKEVKQARLRPYNAEEIPDLPFEVTKKESSFRTTVVSCQDNNVWLAGALTAISTENLMRHFTIDGKPCGVLEHLENGEWIK